MLCRRTSVVVGGCCDGAMGCARCSHCVVAEDERDSLQSQRPSRLGQCRLLAPTLPRLPVNHSAPQSSLAIRRRRLLSMTVKMNDLYELWFFFRCNKMATGGMSANFASRGLRARLIKPGQMGGRVFWWPTRDDAQK